MRGGLCWAQGAWELPLEQLGDLIDHAPGTVLAPQRYQRAEKVGAQVPQGLDVAGITQPHVHARHVGAGHADQALQHGPAHFFQPLVAHPCRG